MDFSSVKLKQDSVDLRDYIFTCSAPVTNFPSSVDLRPFTPQIENQLSLSSCTANAGVNALEILLAKANQFTDLSRLFLYYNERINESLYRNGLEDKGAYLRDVFKTCSKYGICKEEIWPYVLENVNVKPSEQAYQDAKLRKVEEYRRIAEYTFGINGQKDNYAIDQTKICLAKGFPVIITLSIYSKFRTLRGPLEEQNYRGSFDKNDSYVGKHAMCIVGYDDDLGGFIVENSWGRYWGDNGFFLLKYDVALANITDAWVCTKFAGLTFQDEWEWVDWQKLYNYDTVEYVVYYDDLENGTFILESTVEGGVKPYEYQFWKLLDVTGEDYSYAFEVKPLDGNKCQIKVKNPGDKEYTWTYCVTVTDSGNPRFRVRQYFKVTVKPGSKPKPKPIDPKKDDDTKPNVNDNVKPKKEDNKPKPIDPKKDNNEPKPNPIPPKPKPPEPVKPKHDDKDNDKKNILPFIIGGIGAAVILGSIIFKFFVG